MLVAYAQQSLSYADPAEIPQQQRVRVSLFKGEPFRYEDLRTIRRVVPGLFALQGATQSTRYRTLVAFVEGIDIGTLRACPASIWLIRGKVLAGALCKPTACVSHHET